MPLYALYVAFQLGIHCLEKYPLKGFRSMYKGLRNNTSAISDGYVYTMTNSNVM